jgi:CrcB protein
MTSPGISAFLVGIGGFAGSVTRYGLSAASQRLSFEWPFGTMAANVAGCFVIGIIVGLAARGGTVSPEARLLLATGFCGGLTTMSSMVYETAEMIRASEYLHAAVYATGSYAASMAAFFAGLVAVRLLIRSGGGLWS